MHVGVLLRLFIIVCMNMSVVGVIYWTMENLTVVTPLEKNEYFLVTIKYLNLLYEG